MSDPSKYSYGANLHTLLHAEHDKFIYLWKPKHCAIYTLLRGKIPSETCNGFEFKWWVDTFLTRRFTIGGSDDGATLSFTFGSTVGIVAGDILVNVTQGGEQIKVASVDGATTLTAVARGFGATSAATSPSGDVWVNIGQRRKEDSRSVDSIVTTVSELQNYLAFFSRSVQTTEWLKAIGTKEMWTNTPEHTRQRAKAAEELKIDIGLSWYMGTLLQDTSEAGNVTYSSAGLYEQLNGGGFNSDLSNALLTENLLFYHMDQLVEEGDAKVYHVLGRPKLIGHIGNAYGDKMRFTDKKLGKLDFDLKSMVRGGVEFRFIADPALGANHLAKNDLIFLDLESKSKQGACASLKWAPGFKPHFRDAKPENDRTIDREETVAITGVKFANKEWNKILYNCGTAY